MVQTLCLNPRTLLPLKARAIAKHYFNQRFKRLPPQLMCAAAAVPLSRRKILAADSGIVKK